MPLLSKYLLQRRRQYERALALARKRMKRYRDRLKKNGLNSRKKPLARVTQPVVKQSCLP